jgi:hypothetical protein
MAVRSRVESAASSYTGAPKRIGGQYIRVGTPGDPAEITTRLRDLEGAVLGLHAGLMELAQHVDRLVSSRR